MKKSKIVAAIAAAAMMAGFCGTASAVSWKDFKEAAKKDFNEKVNQASGNSSSEDAEESSSASSSSKSSKSGGKSSGSVKAAAANRGPNSEDDFEFSLNDDLTEITITKYVGTRKDVIIPATIQDVPVVYIGMAQLGKYGQYNSSTDMRAFKGTPITSVVVPDGVKSIGYYCFSGCTNLEKVTLPKSCTRLVQGAFYGCTELESIMLPDTVTIIGKSCFSGCEMLTEFKYPASLKYIGENAFAKVPLESVDIPEGVEWIGREAFVSDTIISVSLPKSLKWIGEGGGYNGIINSASIESISVADGCSPTFIGSDSKDGRSLIKSSKVEKSVKLQKELMKIKPAQNKVNNVLANEATQAALKSYGCAVYQSDYRPGKERYTVVPE